MSQKKRAEALFAWLKNLLSWRREEVEHPTIFFINALTFHGDIGGKNFYHPFRYCFVKISSHGLNSTFCLYRPKVNDYTPDYHI